ncbi:hypothetical protein EJ08DRAFT_718458, partial [Tothia fuscella]
KDIITIIIFFYNHQPQQTIHTSTYFSLQKHNNKHSFSNHSILQKFKMTFPLLNLPRELRDNTYEQALIVFAPYTNPYEFHDEESDQVLQSLPRRDFRIGSFVPFTIFVQPLGYSNDYDVVSNERPFENVGGIVEYESKDMYFGGKLFLDLSDLDDPGYKTWKQWTQQQDPTDLAMIRKITVAIPGELYEEKALGVANYVSRRYHVIHHGVIPDGAYNLTAGNSELLMPQDVYCILGSCVSSETPFAQSWSFYEIRLLNEGSVIEIRTPMLLMKAQAKIVRDFVEARVALAAPGSKFDGRTILQIVDWLHNLWNHVMPFLHEEGIWQSDGDGKGVWLFEANEKYMKECKEKYRDEDGRVNYAPGGGPSYCLVRAEIPASAQTSIPLGQFQQVMQAAIPEYARRYTRLGPDMKSVRSFDVVKGGLEEASKVDEDDK